MSYSTDTFLLAKVNYVFDNNTITHVSLWLFYAYIAAFVFISSLFSYELFKYTYKKCRHKHISKKPTLSLLWSIFILEILVYAGLYWWIIKATIFFSSTRHYCANVYSPINQYVNECRDDSLCRTKVHGDYSINEENYICDNGYTYSGKTDNNCYCARKGNHEVFMGIWWMVWGLVTIWTTHHIVSAVRNKFYFPHLCGCFWNTSHCIFWRFCICSTTKQWKESFFVDLYWRRLLWFGKQKPVIKDDCQCCSYFLQFGYYILFILFGSIFYGMYSGMIEANSGMKWYDFYPVLLLLVIKLVMQRYYMKGDEYFLEQDWVPFIHEILQQKYGNNLGRLIESYLSIFYNPKICSSDLLFLDADGELLDVITLRIGSINMGNSTLKDATFPLLNQ